jgi:hypothetical protein
MGAFVLDAPGKSEKHNFLTGVFACEAMVNSHCLCRSDLYMVSR